MFTDDISNGQGHEDAVSGERNRADEALDPAAYRAGWLDGIRSNVDQHVGHPQTWPFDRR